LIIFANVLEKKSKLRNFFETNLKTLCIPCYLDNDKDLEIIAKAEFKKNNIILSRESINLLIEKSNNDRNNLKNEIENAKNMGAVLKKELQFLSEEFPAYVTNPRGLGLFAAFDLPSQTERDKVIGGLLKNKLLMLPSGDDAIRFRPHLNVTSEDLKTSIDIIKSTIKATLN